MISTLDVAPRPATGRGAASNAETPHAPGYTAIGQALTRAGQPDYFTWLDHIRPAAGCTRPIRLIGEIITLDGATGRLLSAVRTHTLPDGQIYKACGNRRRTVCPSCAHTYQGDAYQLLRSGLVGGKGVPETVAQHPTVFATFTAPSFGPVHTRRTNRHGTVLACRPRREPELCPHGIDLRCHRLHNEDDPLLGTPLCLDCYDHRHQVVWNNHASELWRRTRITLERRLRRTARALGVDGSTLRLRYAKVAEMQRRGVVHFHAVIRLDGHDPTTPEAILPPPAALTTAHLIDAITAAAHQTALTTEPHPANPTGWPITWGEQLDVRPVTLTGDLTDRKVAAYLAKYATKATEATGHTSTRLTTDTIDLYANPDGTHPERLIHACWTLGAHPGWSGLRRWAHMLGYGGHFLTKARRYSTTFRLLRDTRTAHRRHQEDQEQTGIVRAVNHTGEETTLTVGLLTFAGAGWRTTGDALLANTAAALARTRQQVAREELAHEQSRVLAAA
ncbi:MAG TPA: replication initiator [Micromonosporaceae bacterium]